MFFAVPWVRLQSQRDSTMVLFIFVKTMADQFRDVTYTRSLTESTIFLVKKQFFLHWIRHRYQSKTCVEHIQQVIDKSLINPTNSSMNLYFLHVRVICFQYCKKRMRKSNQENFNFFGRIYGHVRFIFSISVIGFKYMQRIL